MRTAPLATLLALLLFAGRAQATSNFPPAMQTDLSLKAAPQCALCHTDGSAGGRGTVNTPFGISVRSHGLVAYDTTSLQTALTAMAADGTDSDGDCIPDITELKDGTNPNVADSGKTCGPPVTASTDLPGYGCGAHIAPTSSPGASWIGASSLLGLLVIATRRRRARRSVRRGGRA